MRATTALSSAILAVTCLAVTCALAVSPPLVAQDLGGGYRRVNLDLPHDLGVGNAEEHDEDAPGVVVFYGQAYEGDGVFLAVQRGGLGHGHGGDGYQHIRREVTRMIGELSERMYFGLVFFDQVILKFPANGIATRATASQREGAIRWATNIQGGHGTCCREGLLAALRFANTSPTKRRVVVYVGTGAGRCHGQSQEEYLQETLTAFRSANYLEARCHTVDVGHDGPVQQGFMRDLAAMNRGTYAHMVR